MRYYLYVLRSTMVTRLYVGSTAEPDARLSRTTLGEFVPPKRGDPGSVFYLKNIQTALPLRRGSVTKIRLGPQRARSTFGEVAEWLNAAVLKTAVGLAPTVGSNPTLSANEC